MRRSRAPRVAENSEESVSEVFRRSFPDAEASDFRTHVWKGGPAQHPGDGKPLQPTMLHALALAAKLGKGAGITLLSDKEAEPEQHLSYAELFRRAKAMAVKLSEAGVQKDECVLIVLPTGFEFITVFFALQLMGAVPVPTYPPARLRAEAALMRLAQLVGHAGIKTCVVNEAIVQRLPPEAAGILDRILQVEQLAGPTPKTFKARASRSSPAFIQYTSGSTGLPKGVLLTHANLVANIHAIGQGLHIQRADRTASWLPLYHDMGLIGTLLFSIYWRIPLVLMSPLAFLSNPSRWLRAIHEHRCTLSPAPNFAFELCVKRVPPHERQQLDLSSWRIALNGAEAVSAQTLDRFQEAFGPQGFSVASMMPVYGLAESSLAVTFSEAGQPPRIIAVDRDQLARGRAVLVESGGIELVSVGRALPGTEVRVVDEAGNRRPDGQVGHIITKSPSVMKEYYRSHDATSEVLKDGWLWTGDLGFCLEGELFISGRAKDLIIVRGRNYYPDDIERTADHVPGVRGGSVAFSVEDPGGVGERAVLVVESKITRGDEVEALQLALLEQVATACDLRLGDVVVVPPGTLPRTSSGKKQRRLTRARYLKGELKR
jgi:acyl-CoA synthetase (AMP-forming)/AMP-acid ligase II